MIHKDSKLRLIEELTIREMTTALKDFVDHRHTHRIQKYGNRVTLTVNSAYIRQLYSIKYVQSSGVKCQIKEMFSKLALYSALSL